MRQKERTFDADPVPPPTLDRAASRQRILVPAFRIAGIGAWQEEPKAAHMFERERRTTMFFVTRDHRDWAWYFAVNTTRQAPNDRCVRWTRPRAAGKPSRRVSLVTARDDLTAAPST